MKILANTVLAGLILAAGAVALPAQAPTADKLATGTYIVFPPSPQVWRVKADPATMSNITIAGHFVVTGGTPKTIDVLVFNEENYGKWKDEDTAVRAAAKPLASALRSAEGNITAKLTEAGYYYLVISDRYEYEGKKTVVGDIKLQYEKH